MAFNPYRYKRPPLALKMKKKERVMEVTIWLKESSEPMEYDNVVNTYTKGDLFCVYLKSEKVHKFPVNTIFRIVESYGTHSEGSIQSKEVDYGTV